MRGYLQRRRRQDGSLTITIRYSTYSATGAEIVRGETIRQEPGEDPRQTEKRARDLLAQRRTEVVQRRYVPPAEMSLADLVNRYLDARAGDLAAATIGRYRRAFTLVPLALAQQRIDRIETLDLQALYGRLRTLEHSANGIRNLHKLLSGAFRQAVAWGIAVKSPATGVRVPVPTKRAPAVWSERECAIFLTQHKSVPDNAALWRLLLGTGMRIGEALALQWRDIDLERAVVSVHRTMTNDENGKVMMGTVPKTSRSRRTVALPASCVLALRQVWERQQFRIRSAGETWIGGKGDQAAVFAGPNGHPLHDDTVRSSFRRALQTTGVPRIRPHDLRHTNATNDLRAGTSPKVVADRLGISVQVLLDTYGHAMPDMHRAAADAFDARLERELASLDDPESDKRTQQHGA